ncbi:argininosuccinate synthase [Propionigenium maris DSM 9537]|uniref:Argininosuccinate synthase n=1 Tax=Propionigenium maris DSM 9537 TaxID=1123000 RepID=A0A9W6GLA4_9FUSO|nr:argininosuccinate synthase [Propionigenium maris]GLI56245.1 argininosuccinate synthase [Propionigenium maris DSM 9537]
MNEKNTVKEKVVLAYSGGLDTSIIVPWLKENYDLEVIAACINVGQDDDMEEVKEKAISSGASKIYIEEVTEEFLSDYVFKALKAGAMYEGRYLLGTAYARPLMAKKLVEIAHKEGAKYICHGCTGKGNDQVRFEVGVASFDPTIKIIAPWREWDIESREDAIDYAQSKGIKLSVTKEKIYSRDQNIWHISHEGGEIEGLGNEHMEEDFYMMTTPPKDAPDVEEYVEVEFYKGTPVAVNGEKLGAVELVSKLNEIGGRNGIGIIDIVENRLVGMKSRGVYETPGGTILYKALEDLESICMDKESWAFKKSMALKYAELTYNGLWFSPLKEAMDCLVEKLQEGVSGTVKLKLYKGNIKVAGKWSENALYDEEVSSFGASDLYNHSDAEGFIKLFSLPSKINAMMKQKKGL